MVNVEGGLPKQIHSVRARTCNKFQNYAFPYPFGFGLRTLCINNFRSIRVTPTFRDSSGGITGLFEKPLRLPWSKLFGTSLKPFIGVY
jgi:hypothetical protein